MKQLTPVITKYTPFLANQPQWKNMRTNNPFSAPWFEDWLKKQPEIISAGMQITVSELATKSLAQNIDLTKDLQRVSFDSFSLSVAGKYLPDYAYKLLFLLERLDLKDLSIRLYCRSF